MDSLPNHSAPLAPPPYRRTKRRTAWLTFVYATTFLLPTFLLKRCVANPLAFREKLSFCLAILMLWTIAALITEVLPRTVCSHHHRLENRKACITTESILITLAFFAGGAMIFKVIAALYVFNRKQPLPKMKQQPHTLLFMPVYSEDEATLRKTIDSLSESEYEDDKKLLFIVVDGMIQSKGSDYAEHEVLLVNVLGYKGQVEEPRYYRSAGAEGPAMNQAAVYSGRYAVGNRMIPYIVVVKTGMDHEEDRKRGNRGKRDSQILLMNWLQNLNFSPDHMYPLDLEITMRIKNLGLDPQLYEYFVLADADTYVHPDGLLRLMHEMVSRPYLAGVCGDTYVANPTESMIAAAQAMEYFVGHTLGKCSESVMQTVLVLSGCFAAYRIKRIKDIEEGWSPVITHPELIKQFYGGPNLTLHERNLLCFGEDRYLTTLLIKYFPDMCTDYIPAARCSTTVPTTLKVLISQRRRWTNSMIHCHIELLFECPFASTRHNIVRLLLYLDFATMFFCAYYFVITIISVVLTSMNLLPLTKVVGAALLVLPILIAFGTRKPSMIIWFLPYIFMFGIFSFVIPNYSYWASDNFTWGSTQRLRKTKSNMSLFDKLEVKAQISSVKAEARLNDLQIVGDSTNGDISESKLSMARDLASNAIFAPSESIRSRTTSNVSVSDKDISIALQNLRRNLNQRLDGDGPQIGNISGIL